MFCDCVSVQVLSMRLLDLVDLHPAMGSNGWDQCYWCDYWQFNMYIPDGVNAPLCEWCIDRFADGYGPYRPDARDRSYSQIYQVGWMQKLGYELWWIIISEYIHDEFEP